MTNEYPLSEFTGIDKTKLFPSLIKPSNLNFIHANILEGLPFQQNHFDFVYLNIVEPRYTKEQWAFIISELIRVAKPGGYIEVSIIFLLQVLRLQINIFILYYKGSGI